MIYMSQPIRKMYKKLMANVLGGALLSDPKTKIYEIHIANAQGEEKSNVSSSYVAKFENGCLNNIHKNDSVLISVYIV